LARFHIPPAGFEAPRSVRLNAYLHRRAGAHQQQEGERPPRRRALHEAFHAHGIKNEAQTNCYAVQLTPLFRSNIGLNTNRSACLGALARRYVRFHAPAEHWNAAKCRDHGPWDLYPGITNSAASELARVEPPLAGPDRAADRAADGEEETASTFHYLTLLRD